MIISIANFKGGSGKTSTCLNLAAGLARRGKKVLLMDFDPQCDLTNSLLGVDAPEPNYGTYHLFDTGTMFWAECINVQKNLDLLPSSLSMIDMEVMMSSKNFRETVIDKALKGDTGPYDFIIIDTPPYIGNLTINAVIAADFLLCPVETEFFALKGLHIFKRALRRIHIDIDGIIATKYDSRKILNNQVLDALKGMGDEWLGVVIRENVSIAESPYHKESIFQYKLTSNGAKDYADLAREVIKIKKHEQAEAS